MENYNELVGIVCDTEVLSQRSDEINVVTEAEELKQIAKDMKKAVYDYNLASLAAIQINVPRRVFAINFKGDIRIYVNPIITKSVGFEISEETCSSIPNKRFIIPRANKIVLTYQTTSGKVENKEFVGMSAKVVQHCIDHLEGVLLSDIGFEIDENWDKASDDEKAEVIKYYLDSIQTTTKELNAEIEKDDNLKQMNDAIDFLEKMQKGEVQVTYETVTKENNGSEHNRTNTTEEDGQS